MRPPAGECDTPEERALTNPVRCSVRIAVSALTVVIFAMTALLGTSRTGTVQLSSSTQPVRNHSNSDTSTPEPGSPQTGGSATKKSKAKNSRSRDSNPRDPVSYSPEPTPPEPTPVLAVPRPTPVHVVPPRPAPPL